MILTVDAVKSAPQGLTVIIPSVLNVIPVQQVFSAPEVPQDQECIRVHRERFVPLNLKSQELVRLVLVELFPWQQRPLTVRPALPKLTNTNQIKQLVNNAEAVLIQRKVRKLVSVSGNTDISRCRMVPVNAYPVMCFLIQSLMRRSKETVTRIVSLRYGPCYVQECI